MIFKVVIKSLSFDILIAGLLACWLLAAASCKYLTSDLRLPTSGIWLLVSGLWLLRSLGSLV
jgi:hypothetical protein